ncbi:MAG: peroxiredoxin [Bacteroidetes bacterium]|nr:peroxiredoxin [Bacteroidota bacterium]MBL6963430.1 peroxiredoxin [Bacteroidota bacterium]
MMSLVGKKAPAFVADAVINGGEIVAQFSLEQYIGEKYVVFFFYPLDFTFVCPTEIIAFQKSIAEFEKRGAVVVGCSVDSKFSHWAWLNTAVEKGGIQGVKFPLVADLSKTIAINYGVLAGEYDMDDENNWVFNGAPVAFRGLFLIDKKGTIQHELVNSLDLGRSTAEAIRMLDALKHFEEFGEVCPANWQEGDDAMKPSSEGVAEYLASH